MALTNEQLLEWASDARKWTVRHQLSPSLWDTIYDAEALAVGKPTRKDAVTIEQEILASPVKCDPPRETAAEVKPLPPWMR